MPLSRPPQFRFLLFWTALLAVPGLLRADDPVDFEKQVLPLLDNACFKCHSAEAKKVKGDLRLDTLSAIRAKSRSDNLVFPHKPEKSKLYERINLPEGDEDLMPPPDSGKPLSQKEVALVKKWIEEGASFGSWKNSTPAEKRVSVQFEAVDPTDVEGTARHIDQLIEEGLTKKGQKPNPLLGEDLWCRRVYLDLAGRIPTYNEMASFLRARDPQKRSKLINTLLGSNGHVSTMYNYWCDALRARDTLVEDASGDYYLAYIKQSILNNKPYDQWAKELVSAGGGLERTAAVGFYLRDFGNRFANVDNTSMLFLGTQIGCAQCHDHPYDKWTRRDYHQFAAWTSAVESKRRQDEPKYRESDLEAVQKELEKEAEKPTSNEKRERERDMALRAIERMIQRNRRDREIHFTVRNGDEAKGKLPEDYQYPDGKPGAPVDPKVLFGYPPENDDGQVTKVFAEWLTSPINPRFAQTIANRMWARVMGASFSGDIQNVRDIDDCANPQLAAYLTHVMAACRFDLQQFQRIITNTQTYARAAGASSGPDADYLFPGPLLRRMSAEQAWDSMLTLIVPDLDVKIGFPEPAAPSKPAVTTERPTPEKIREMVEAEVKEYLKERGGPARRGNNNPGKPAGPMATEYGTLLRASELAQPAPEGHFLRVFGQSNREIADGGWRSGTVPQTLMMLNSTLFDLVVQRGSAFQSAMSKDTGDSGRLRVAFLAILGRQPTLEEISSITSAMGGTGNSETIAHTLLGTRQFLFIQ